MHPKAKVITAAAISLSLLLAACGSDPVEVPRVAGLRLDDAHNALRDGGFENVEDVDALNDREPLMDSNWAVVQQTPSAGEQFDPEDVVTLRIAKPEDEGIREMLPADSPVLAEIREADAQRDALAEADRREQEAKDRADAIEQTRETKSYTEKIDPAARLAQAAIIELRSFRDALSSGSESYASVGPYVSSFGNTMDSYASILDQRDPPDSVTERVDGLRGAVESFTLAAQTLYSATGATASESFQRFSDVYATAVSKYNFEMQLLYAGTQIEPPLL
ncbi:PASTA domain-containing protein [Rhodococcus sp. BP-332]|uniref:PASTA domain-containing protein n=1 Tax=Rhodococcus sp. BP-332 TaxID=2739447 RepID=UPI001C9A5537|nr:PASTA domain-containing protein [Rhodococcus sp. BP-332]MBY6676540.1 PASTA domain-containing protein [Rhodococcus sp. BP-332]